MLVALSDLHFQDVDLSGDARIGHNTAAASYLDFFESIADAAEECGAKEIAFLLNGDTFDLLRTERWFRSKARPYDDGALTPEASSAVVEILDHIDRTNRDALDIFRAVARNDSARLGFRFSARPRFVFIPGNHDRYLRLVPAAAQTVREWLDLSSPLEQALLAPEYRLFARHGHEYDWLNSEYNFEFLRRDAGLGPELYGYACLGDWLAIDVATRIPYEFKRMFGDLPEVYRAIVEIDDVRPMTSVFQWLQSVTGSDTEAWKKVRRAIEETLKQAFADGFIERWIASHDRPGFLDRVDFFKFVVRPMSRNVGLIPDSMIQSCLNMMRGKEDRTTEEKILTDADFARSGMSVLCHGHYHDGGVTFLQAGQGAERAVVCTGSWRAQHSLCYDGRTYFKGRRFSHAIFHTQEEARRRGGRHYPFSFEYIERYATA